MPTEANGRPQRSRVSSSTENASDIESEEAVAEALLDSLVQEQSPWEYLDTIVRHRIPPEHRQRFYPPFVALVSQRPIAEQDALLAQGQPVFRYRAQTARDEVAVLRANGASLTQIAPTVLAEDFMAEIVHRPGESPSIRYLVYKRDGSTEIADSVQVGSVLYHPPQTRLIDTRTLLLPTDVEEYEDQAALFRDVRFAIDAYLHVEDIQFRNIMAYYTLLSWIYDRFDVVPYLRFQGEWGPQPLDAKVLTPRGFVRMGDLKVDDRVISRDGTATRVQAVLPRGEKQVYRVTFSDGAITECCDNHRWLTQTYTERQQSRRHGREIASVKALSDIRASLKTPWCAGRNGEPQYNHSIPVPAPVQLEHRDVPLDPYVLGALLGDGGLTGTTILFCSADAWIVKQIVDRLPDGYSVNRKSLREYDYTISRGYACGSDENTMMTALRNLGVWGCRGWEKFIPESYKNNDVDTRLAVLRGLMDTDGTAKLTHASFKSTSERLALDVVDLVRSLGGLAYVNHVAVPLYYKQRPHLTPRPQWRVIVTMPDGINPFTLPRKVRRVRWNARTLKRFIVDVHPARRTDVQCISVEHPSQTYVTDDFVVTMNTGKTRGLQVIGALSYRPIMAGGATTSSPIFRLVSAFRGTLVIDEADFGDSDMWTDIVKILNCGYMKGFPVLRMGKDARDKWDPESFDCFGPKLLSTRRRFRDQALESRCLSYTMPLTAVPQNIPYYLDEEFRTHTATLRNKMLLWRFRRFRDITADPRQRIDGLDPRLNQIVIPLLACAEDEHMRSAIVTVARQYQATLRDDRRESFEGRVAYALLERWRAMRAHALGEFLLKEVVDQLRLDLGEQAKLDSRRIGDVVRHTFGLTTRYRGGNTWVILQEQDVRRIALRYSLPFEAFTRPASVSLSRPRREPMQ